MTTLEKDSLDLLRGMRREIALKLSAFRGRVKARLVMEGMAIFAAELVGAAVGSFLLDHTFRLGVAARVGMVVVLAAALGYEFWRRVVGALRLRVGLVALAGAVGKREETRDLAARVATVLELPGLLQGDSPPSAEMVERAVARCHGALSGVDFGASLDEVRMRKMAGVMAGAIVVAGLLAVCFPAKAGLWARRMFLLSREPWPQSTYLDVLDLSDGRIRVPRGEAYVVRVHARAGSVTPERVGVTIRGAGGGGRTTVLMKEFGKNDFRHEFSVVDQPLTLEIDGGDDEVGPISVEPVDRPRIVGLELVSQHPRDKAPVKHEFGGDTDLNFLVKTRLSLLVASNVPLKEMRLKPDSPLPTVNNVRRVDATHYAVEWVQTGPARFALELVAADTGLVSVPAAMSVGLRVDQVPRVTMTYSGVHPRITPSALIPLTIEARDDFGVKVLALAVKDETADPMDPAKLVAHEGGVGLFPESGAGQAGATQPAATQSAATESGPLETDLQMKQTVDVATMKLLPGALVSLTADATDDCYTGAQTGRSRTVTFRLVAPEELFREILLRQQGERAKYRKQVEETEKIRDGLRTVVTAKEAAALAGRHRAMQRETLRIATALTESLTEIKLNRLGSPESHALMEHNVLQPMAALEKELVAPQTQGLDTLFPAEGAPDGAAIAAAADREDKIAGRMNGILKQMAQWDSFVDVLNQLDEIIKLETQVKDQSEKLKKTNDEGLFDK